MLGEDLIDKAVVNVDTSRISTRKVTDEFLEGRRILKRAHLENRKQFFTLWLEPGRLQLLGVFERLLRVDENPSHQRSAFALLASGSAIASRIDLRMPGIDSKCIVSWIAFQSSSETRTAELRLPAIRTGS